MLLLRILYTRYLVYINMTPYVRMGCILHAARKMGKTNKKISTKDSERNEVLYLTYDHDTGRHHSQYVRTRQRFDGIFSLPLLFFLPNNTPDRIPS